MIRAKHRQALGLMREHGIDTWLIQFARETGLRPDPLDYLVGASVTWPSAFLLNHDGSTAAIVGTGDAGTFESTGLWTEVRAFRNGPRDDLLDVLTKWDPKTLGVTWSDSDDTADGITHGMYHLLETMLAGTRFADRLVAAGELAGEVRGIKLPEEVEAIARTVRLTEELLERIERRLEPGITEIGLQREVHGWVREAGWRFSWDDEFCPMVNFGQPAFLGHAGPTERALEPGDVIHVDIGLIVDGFASDLQRTWYWRRLGETTAPPAVTRTFDAVKAGARRGRRRDQAGREGLRGRRRFPLDGRGMGLRRTRVCLRPWLRPGGPRRLRRSGAGVGALRGPSAFHDPGAQRLRGRDGPRGTRLRRRDRPRGGGGGHPRWGALSFKPTA